MPHFTQSLKKELSFYGFEPVNTIIGKEQKGVILTLVERVTGFTIIRLLEHGKDRIFHSKLHFGVENTPDRQNIYSAALGLYNSRIVKLINKKHQLKSSVIIDELPTIYFRGLDNLIATARSNKVAVCLGFQDFSQLTRDYGDKESKVIQNTVGNVFSGQVVGETAKTLSERFGKVLQQRQSMTINRNDKSTSISTQMDSLIPASKISNLTQGMFVGAVSDNFDERIDQKIFHAEIVVDVAKVSAETKAYQPIPIIADFTNENGSDSLRETIEANYRQVKQEVLSLVDSETARIKTDPALAHLIKE